MTYKPELDGFRAFALFLVLLTHMELAGVTGGFVGVDVFFVLSGFLITTIIVTGIEKGKFGFWNFYGRRLMRLYPAFLFIMFVTFVAYFVLTDPETFRIMARSARYVVVSASNIFYNNNLGYFDTVAQKQAFLHTWSLGIEWQFYLAWPFIIWVVMKLSGNRRSVLFAVLAAIVLASVVASQWGVHNRPTAAYYLIQYRAFELGIGALLVFIYHVQIKPAVGAGLTFAGVAGIIYLSLTLSGASFFPGINALLVCLAAAACMLGSKAFSKGNFFRLPWVVYMGKSSYSIYLVHWPLLVLTKYYLYRSLFIHERIALVVISIALGCLVFATIETHINWRSVQNKLKACLVMLALTFSFVGVFVYVNNYAHGLPQRIEKQDQALISKQYLNGGAAGFMLVDKLGDPNGKPIAILAGDSFAGSAAFGVNEVLKGSGEYIQLMYYPGCTISQIDETPSLQQGCKAMSQQVIQSANELAVPLILVQSWGTPVILKERNIASYSMYNTTSTYTEFTQKNLSDIHQKIGGKPLFIIASEPYRKWGESELECITRPKIAKKYCMQGIPPYPYQDSPIYPYNEMLKSYAETQSNMFYIEKAFFACPDGICTPERNARLYNDGFHTSIHGSIEVNKPMVEQIKKILSALSELSAKDDLQR